MNTQMNNQLCYLTYSANDEAWGTIITTAGFQHISPHASYPPSQHPKNYNFCPQNGRILNEYQFVYIVKGNGTFISDHCKKRSVKTGDLLILFPGEWHNYYPDIDSGWDEYWVGFKGSYMEHLIDKHFFSPENPILELGISSSLVNLYEDLLQTANNEKAGFQVMLAGILQHITSTIFYKYKNQSFADAYILDKLDEARRMMKSEIEHPSSPEEIAAQLGLSYSWFRRTFKDYTGISPAQYQIQLRLIKAKELLSQTTLNITEIAYQLHFENGGQFSTFFKKREGLTPKEYREWISAANSKE